MAAIRFASPFPPPPKLPTYYVRALFSSTQATMAATDADAAGAALAVYVRMSIRWRSGWLQVIGAGKVRDHTSPHHPSIEALSLGLPAHSLTFAARC